MKKKACEKGGWHGGIYSMGLCTVQLGGAIKCIGVSDSSQSKAKNILANSELLTSDCVRRMYNSY